MRKKKIILPRIYRPPSGNPKGWHVEFSVFDEVTGKMQRFRKTKGFAKCKTEDECIANARRLKKKYTDRLKRGWSPFADKSIIWEDTLEYENITKKKPTYRTKKTIAYYTTLYMDSKKTRAKKTYQTYTSKLRMFRNWLAENKLDEIDISLIEEKHAKKFINDIYYKSSKTKNEYIRLLRDFWNFIANERKNIPNIWDNISKFKNNTIPHQPLKRGVLQLLKSEIKKSKPQLWLAAQFLYYCFIRPGELRQMKIKHIDFIEGRITLFSNMTKNSKTRVVDISDTFLQVLINEYNLQSYPENLFVFSHKGEPGTIPVGHDYFNKQFRKVRDKLNIPSDYKFYAFKHTGAVRALRAGADIKEIQHQMGHSSVAITDEYLKSMVGYESEFFKKRMPEI